MIQLLRSCGSVSIDVLTIGSPNLLFGLVSEAGSGKTCLLLRLHYLLTCHREKMLHQLYHHDTTWAYFELYAPSDLTRLHHPGRDDRPEVIPYPYAEPSHYSHLVGANLATRNVDARKPTRLLSLYVLASDLAEHAVFVNDRLSVHLENLLDAAYQTYQRLCSRQDHITSHETYLAAHQTLFLSEPVTSLFLLIDGLDYLHSASRAQLLNSIHHALSRFGSVLFRVFVAGRPFSYFKLFQDMPPSIYFLYLDKLISQQSKDLFFSVFNPTAVASLSQLPPNAMRLRAHQVFVRTCHSAYLTFLFSQVGEAAISKKLATHELLAYDLLDLLFNSVVAQCKNQGEHQMTNEKRRMFQLLQNEETQPISLLGWGEERVGHVLITNTEFFELVSLVSFLYNCWASVSSKCDLVIRKKFSHFIFILLKHHHDTLNRTVLGKLRAHYISTQGISSALSADNSTQNDDAFVSLARDIWTSVASKLISLDLVHLLPRSSQPTTYNFEILFRDEQILQYLCARFLLNSPLSTSIFSAISDALVNMVDFETDFPLIFCRKNLGWFLTYKKWNGIFDMYASKTGIIQFANKFLPTDQTIYQWLDEIIKNNGVDLSDMGQIRFYRLLKAFSLEHERFQLIYDQVTAAAAAQTGSNEQQPPSSPLNELDLLSDSGSSTSLMHANNLWIHKTNYFDKLGDTFGMTFLSILQHDPTMLIHVSKPPISSFACFSPASTQLIMKELLLFLTTSTESTVTNLLVQLMHRNPDIEGKFTAAILHSIKSKQPFFSTPKFMTVCGQNYKHVEYFISFLSTTNAEEAAFAINFLKKFGLEALNLTKNALQQREADRARQAMSDRGAENADPNDFSTRPPCTHIEHTHHAGHAPMLDQVDMIRSFEMTCHRHCAPLFFSDNEWSIFIHATCRYMRLFHSCSPRLSIYTHAPDLSPPMENLHLLLQHTRKLIKLFRHEDPACRLFPFLVIGSNLPRSSCTHSAQLNAQDTLFVELGAAYLSLSSSNVHGEQSAARSIPGKKLKSFDAKLHAVLLNLFGASVAKHGIKFSLFFRCQIRLLHALNVWVFAHLPKEHRQNLFHSLLNNPDPDVQHAIVNLMQQRCDLLAQMEPIDATNMMKFYLSSKNISESRSCVAALDLLCYSVLSTTSQDYRLHTVDKIVYLLTQYGFHHMWVTEPLLRGLDAIFSTVHLSEQHYGQLISLLMRNNIQCKLLQALRNPKLHACWRLMILVMTLLRHFVQPDNEEMFEYLHFLSWDVPEIRMLAIRQLLTIDDALIPGLIVRLEELVSDGTIEEHCPMQRAMVATLLGQLGLTRNEATFDAIVQLSVKHVKHVASPNAQLRGLAILSILSWRVHEMPSVRDALRDALLHQRDVMLRGNEETETEAATLIIAIIYTLTNTCQILTDIFPILLGLPKECAMLSTRYALSEVVLSYFKMVIPHLADEHRMMCRKCLLNYMRMNKDPFMVELSVKIIRYLGRPVIKQCIPELIHFVRDVSPSLARATLSTLGRFLSTDNEQNKKETLLLLPTVMSALEDRHPQVLKQALKVVARLRAKPRMILASAPCDAMAPRVMTSDDAVFQSEKNNLETRGDLAATTSAKAPLTEASAVGISDYAVGDRELKHVEDLWYTRNVILPNLCQLTNILYKRRYRYNYDLKMSIFQCLVPMKHIDNIENVLAHIVCNKSLQHLAEFAETISQWRTQMFSFIIDVIRIEKVNSLLLRMCMGPLIAFRKLLSANIYSWSTMSGTIFRMLKHKDLVVRKTGIVLLSRHAQASPQVILAIVNMCSDVSNIVRKEAFQTLEDVGRMHQVTIPSILALVGSRNVSSCIMWEFLSKSWRMLISSDSMRTPHEVNKELFRH